MPIYVVGDSHGNHLIVGLTALNKSSVVNMTDSGCIPFRNVDRYDSRSKVGDCAATMNANLDSLANINSRSVVILSSMGPVYLDGTPFNGKDFARVNGNGVELITNKSITNHYHVYEAGMRDTLFELSSNTNLIIIFALDIPELGIDYGCQSQTKKLSIFGFEIGDLVPTVTIESCSVARQDYDERTVQYKKLVFRILEDFPNIHVFDPTTHFCNSGSCHGFIDDFGYLYKDVDHLSTNGSIYYGDRLISSFDFFKNE